MKRLIGVEVSRALSRRLNRVLVIILLGIVLLITVISFLTSRAGFDRESALAEASRIRQGGIEECASVLKGGEEFGHSDPQFANATPSERRRLCEEGTPPVEEFIVDRRFQYAEARQVPQAAGVQLMLLSLLVGASFMGAEWGNRTVTTMLTWEARRFRVFAAKAAAVVGVLAVAGFVAQALILLAFLPAGLLRGTMAGVDASWLGDTALGMARLAGLCGATGLLGMSLATVARNTAGAAGAAFGYILVLESVVRGFRPGWQTWLLGNNIIVFIDGAAPQNDPQRTVLVAAVIVLGYVSVVTGAAASFFRRADIG